MRLLETFRQMMIFLLIVVYAGLVDGANIEISADSLLKKLTAIEDDDSQELKLLNEIIYSLLEGGT